MKLAIDIGPSFFVGGGGQKFQNITNVADLVTFFVRAGLVISGVIMLIFFLLGAIGMIAGAGSGDSKQIEQAKQSLTTAVIGFVIVFLAYWIVKLLVTILGVPTLI